MLFDVPFLPDEDYVRFLTRQRKHLSSVYFSLLRPEIKDARHRLKKLKPDDLIPALKSMPGVPKFALLNSRVHPPGDYLDPAKVEGAADILRRFKESDVLDGIVFADAYYLKALSEVAPTSVQGLQAVPSINFMIDTPDKLHAVLDLISSAAPFRPPVKVFLDRSLNRDWNRLKKVLQWCRREEPQLKIGLLANEGCLYQCPFKLAHDCLIACSHMDMRVDTFNINQAFGCVQILRKNPAGIFQSPFIRPEDVGRYDDLIDMLKICGRTLGAGFLARAFQAYIDGKYRGNLLDLLDASNWMADEVYLANDQLPPDFIERMAGCPRDCRRCDACRKMQDAHMHPVEAGFRDLRQSRSK
jgi:hypothetical protein